MRIGDAVLRQVADALDEERAGVKRPVTPMAATRWYTVDFLSDGTGTATAAGLADIEKLVPLADLPVMEVCYVVHLGAGSSISLTLEFWNGAWFAFYSQTILNGTGVAANMTVTPGRTRTPLSARQAGKRRVRVNVTGTTGAGPHRPIAAQVIWEGREPDGSQASRT